MEAASVAQRGAPAPGPRPPRAAAAAQVQSPDLARRHRELDISASADAGNRDHECIADDGSQLSDQPIAGLSHDPHSLAEFRAEVSAQLREAYPPASYGTVLPFPRIFVVAHRT